MNVLVTGGAGYVGSVVTDGLLRAGHRVLVVDNLQQGHRQAVPESADFVQADIADAGALDAAFGRMPIDAVMHMAGETVVEYSTTVSAAMCTTASIGAPEKAASRPAGSQISACTKSAPAGTASRWPCCKLSSTSTR